MPKLEIPASAEPGKRLAKIIRYHGRSGRPIVHRTRTGKGYIMVRRKGGGTRRLYAGSHYTEK